MTDRRTTAPKPHSDRRHVALLGAGASLAALPNGDKWGRKLPLMNNFVDVVGLAWIFEKYGIEYQGINFETLYSSLATSGQHADAVKLIEQVVFNYFHGMRLPDHPTIYDHLVLSLRPKDFIATFNWDPFLVQAVQRNYGGSRLGVEPPHVAFLHGCVQIGFCDRHEPKVTSQTGIPCPKCGEELTQTRLLYPVGDKDYSDAYSAPSWHDTQLALNEALIFTVFGYGAPTSDAKAVELLKNGWGDPKKRVYELVEIVDRPGRPEEEVTQHWQPFINEEGANIWGDFYSSWIAKCTRRSCDGLWDQQMKLLSTYRDVRIPRDLDFPELWEWFRPMIDAERAYDAEHNRSGR